MSTAVGSHEPIEELVVADVLDGLDGPDRETLAEALRAHGPDCAECRRLLRDYSEVAGALALAVVPVALPSGAEDRLIAKSRRRPAAPTARTRLAAAVRPGQSAAWIVGSGLPTPSGDRVYELWFQPEPSAKMQPAGIFTPTDGRVVAPVTVGALFVVLAVSIEPAGGSRQPTTQPVFVTNT